MGEGGRALCGSPNQPVSLSVRYPLQSAGDKQLDDLVTKLGKHKFHVEKIEVCGHALQ